MGSYSWTTIRARSFAWSEAAIRSLLRAEQARARRKRVRDWVLKHQSREGESTNSAVTPTYGVFRRPKLDTVAGSARRIFLCEGGGGCPGTVQKTRVHVKKIVHCSLLSATLLPHKAKLYSINKALHFTSLTYKYRGSKPYTLPRWRPTLQSLFPTEFERRLVAKLPFYKKCSTNSYRAFSNSCYREKSQPFP